MNRREHLHPFASAVASAKADRRENEREVVLGNVGNVRNVDNVRKLRKIVGNRTLDAHGYSIRIYININPNVAKFREVLGFFDGGF